MAAKKSKKRTQAADEGAAVRRWRDAMRHLLAVLAGGPKGTHRNDGSLFAEDAKERRYYSAIAARDATVDLVDVVRAARADAVAVRELAAWLGKGDLLELDDLLGLWRRVGAIVDEIEAVTQGTKAEAKAEPCAPDYTKNHKAVLTLLVEALPASLKSGDIKVPGLTVTRTRHRVLSDLRELDLANLPKGSKRWRATPAGVKRIGR